MIDPKPCIFPALQSDSFIMNFNGFHEVIGSLGEKDRVFFLHQFQLTVQDSGRSRVSRFKPLGGQVDFRHDLTPPLLPSGAYPRPR